MKILFLSPGVMGVWQGTGRLSSFQQADVDILRSLGHDVRVFLWRGRPFARLLREGMKADLIFAWSLSDHTFVAGCLPKPLVVAIGGYEFAAIKEARYGNLLTRRGRLLSWFGLHRADALLYVDGSLADEAREAFGTAGRAHVVPTGYDPEFWKWGDGERSGVVTVCHVPTQDKVRLKGVDIYLDSARRMPDTLFHVVGEVPDGFPRSKNVVCHGWLERDVLRALYASCAVVCQLSMHEGLPNAVCEAMLCGCVPVVTDVNGNVRAEGGAGVVVRRHWWDARRGILEAMEIAKSGGGVRARKHIVETFPVERRVNAIRCILSRFDGRSPVTFANRLSWNIRVRGTLK
jgi:glycosyltransferase involved in cell wall biosynthesis